MLENSLIVRKYNLSDADLALFANTLVIAMTRDLTEFEAYGVTALKIGDLTDLIDDFQDLPGDESFLADYSYAVEQRDELRFTIENVLRSISVRAKSVFGANSAKYRSLNPGNISQMTESLFLVESRNIHNAAVENLAALTPEGVTALYLTTLNTNIDSYETAISTVANKKIIRDDASETKILKGNELYALVVKYCDYGKTIWNNVSPAKYNDYIIYTTTSPGSLTAPQNFMFDPVNYDFRWSAVENATSYILQSSTDGVNYLEYWSGNALMAPYEESPDTMMYFRVLARNAGGNGPASDVISYDFAPSLAAPQNFTYIPAATTFTWSAVPNAEYYEFQYRAQTTPVWSSLNAGIATNFYHADPNGSYVARVRAVSGTTFGAWSNELEYTVAPPQPD